MADKAVGKVKRVVGPLVQFESLRSTQMMELVYVGNQRLVGEVVRIDHNAADVQGL